MSPFSLCSHQRLHRSWPRSGTTISGPSIGFYGLNVRQTKKQIVVLYVVRIYGYLGETKMVSQCFLGTFTKVPGSFLFPCPNLPWFTRYNSVINCVFYGWPSSWFNRLPHVQIPSQHQSRIFLLPTLNFCSMRISCFMSTYTIPTVTHATVIDRP